MSHALLGYHYYPSSALQVILESVHELTPTETRVEQSDHTQFDLEPQRVIRSRLSQSAVVFLCPISISECTTGPGACLLSFSTVVESDTLQGDY